ncbi:MAG: hypothetical protein K2J70_00805 [Muribaculaceae bacterium]|nr:hypothetical protein [Muribaculaceae bacterium]
MIPDNKHIEKKSPRLRVAKIIGYSIGGLLLLIILLLAGATWWLTPERLTRIVNREASENLYADVKASDVRFTLWSSWPHLCVEFDSVTVRSRVFDSIPASLKQSLPSDAAFLASASHFRGGINLLSMLRGRISLSDVEIGSLRLNLFSLNDSLSNFDIIPPDSTKTRIPYFTSDRITLLDRGMIRYRSVPDSADAAVDIKALTLERRDKKVGKGKEDRYGLRILGDVDASVGALTVLRGFPFDLGGEVDLGFDPFRFSTKNYNVNLGSIHGDIDMKMQVGGDSSLDAFRWHLDNFDLIRFLSFLPGVSVPTGGSFEAPLTVNATARLTSPWHLSSDILPSAEVDFEVVDGNMDYTMEDGRRIVLRHEGARGQLLFDGADPAASSFVIPPFRITGEGTDVMLGASMTRLLATPEVEGYVQGKAGIAPLANIFPMLKGFAPKGDAEAQGAFSARLVPLSQIASAEHPVKDMEMQGNVTLSDFSFSPMVGGRKMTASGKSLELSFATPADSASSLPESLPFLVKGEGINLAIPSKKITLSLKDLQLDGTVPASLLNGTGLKNIPRMSAGFKSSALSLRAGKDRVDLNGISLDLSATPNKKEITVADYRMPPLWNADLEIRSDIPHSSPFLEVKLPEEAREMMRKWRSYAHLKIASGVISTPDFPAANRLRNVDIAASFDSIVVRNISLRSRSSAMSMRGSVTNLRQFLNSSIPAPLYVDMDVAIDTVQVNQLAGTYMRGAGRHADSAPANPGADTVALLLPRNLFADIHASAKMSQYMDLHLYDLAAGLWMHDGDLDVENLRISADFGHAFLDFGMKTSDIERIGMTGDVALSGINVVGFFRNFHTLLLMMPQMKNLEGEISAEANFSLLTFPDMYVNIPSMAADIRIQGDGLTVHQSPFIRHITRMLLIREDGDLHIADMNVHASLHDNLLELYPFNFIVDKYRLRMGGVNNFNGDLYYHIGVEKSFIPFPFGINIIGNISKPKIRFGGAHWKIKKGEEITASVMEEHKINIVAEGKKFLKEFIRKAAEADK